MFQPLVLIGSEQIQVAINDSGNNSCSFPYCVLKQNVSQDELSLLFSKRIKNVERFLNSDCGVKTEQCVVLDK